MPRYVRKPESVLPVIYAVKFTRDNFQEVVTFTDGLAENLRIEKCIDGRAFCEIHDKKGKTGYIVLAEGDYIIRHGDSDFYMCPAESFEGKYVLDTRVTRFEVGKYYRHTTGYELHTICEVETTMRGKGILAETNGRDEVLIVGTHEEHAINFTEITKEEWMRNFNM